MATLAPSTYLTQPENDGMIVPIGAKTYRIPPVSAALGLRIQAFTEEMMRRKGDVTDEEVENWVEGLGYTTSVDMYRDLLGDTLDEMLTDRLSMPTVEHVAMTALAQAFGGDEVAEYYWEHGDFPEPEADPKGVPQDYKPSRKN